MTDQEFLAWRRPRRLSFATSKEEIAWLERAIRKNRRSLAEEDLLPSEEGDIRQGLDEFEARLAILQRTL